MSGRIGRADASRCGDRVDDLLDVDGAVVIICDVGGLIRPDAAVVDAVCRIRLAARRRGGRLALRNASPELLDLLDLVGLCDILPVARRSGPEAQGQPEQGEHPCRIEEEGDRADPIA